ncbi:MAG: hypothetical protein ABI402_09125 [Ferruginibacter sp.]
MKKDHEKIIIILSIDSSCSHRCIYVIYSLIFRLAELMNDEAKAADVITTVLVPGTMDTIQNRKAMPDANFNNWVKTEAIADTVLYYCSEITKAIREPLIKLYGGGN